MGPPIRTGSLPVATYCLILAQGAVWLIVRRFLLDEAAWTRFALFPGAPSELGLLISPFVHLDPAHLGVNLAILWLFGTNLERSLGSFQFLFFYLGAAWFAALMQWAVSISFHFTPDPTLHDAAVGSSGAVAGVLGASIVRFPQARLRMPLLPHSTFPATPLVVLWLMYTIARALITTVSGVSEGVGHWAHFAGAVFGLGMAQVLRLHRVARMEFLRRAAEDAGSSGSLVQAAQAWSALLALAPEDLESRTALVACRLQMSDLPGARRLAREGIESLVRSGDRARAVEAYSRFGRTVPGLDLPAGVRFRVGCWLSEFNRDEEAFEALWESAREDARTPAAAGTLYRAGLLAAERMESAARARQAWSALLRDHPDSPWAESARRRLADLPTAGAELPQAFQ